MKLNQVDEIRAETPPEEERVKRLAQSLFREQELIWARRRGQSTQSLPRMGALSHGIEESQSAHTGAQSHPETGTDRAGLLGAFRGVLRSSCRTVLILLPELSSWKKHKTQIFPHNRAQQTSFYSTYRIIKSFRLESFSETFEFSHAPSTAKATSATSSMSPGATSPLLKPSGMGTPHPEAP